MNYFKDIIKFSIYTIYFQVGIKIEDGKETIVVYSNRFNKPKIYYDMDDYIQQIHQDLQGIWKLIPKSHETQAEMKNAINIVNNHFIYCMCILLDQKRDQEKYTRAQMRKDFPISYRKLETYFKQAN